MNYIFTHRALERLLECASDSEWSPIPKLPTDGSWDIGAYFDGSTMFIVGTGDPIDAPRLIIIDQPEPITNQISSDTWQTILQRILTVAKAGDTLPLRLPANWSAYHDRNLFAFFACKESEGALRWVAELAPDNSKDIVFWQLTTPKKQVELYTFSSDTAGYRRLVSNWAHAYSEIAKARSDQTASLDRPRIQASFDLDRVGFRAVARGKTASAWMDYLTHDQRAFVEAEIPHAISLRGPAGSGKTLCLALKALRVANSLKTQPDARIACITHSWAVAEQVDELLRALDEDGVATAIFPVPLLQLAKDTLPPERQAPGYRLLGEDSLTGRRKQLTLIDEAVERIVKSDWLAFKRHASAAIATRVIEPRDSHVRNSLVWDLMNEFSAVMGAHGIYPGVSGEKRYLGLHRADWMMPIQTETDKLFVLRVYSEYIKSIKAERLLPADQLVADFLSYLETFAWNLRRERDGYDVIFVDELHLFSEQERLVMNFLTRNAGEYPKMVMALDPRQAPTEVYADFRVGSVVKAESGSAESELGEVTAYKLRTVHRFSPQILQLVQHIHRSYPALDLGEAWHLDPDALHSSAGESAAPQLFTHRTREDEVESVAGRVGMSTQPCTAVVVLDGLRLPEFVAHLKRGRTPVVVIESREDLNELKYRQRRIVIGAPENLAGLQFERVLVVGCTPRQMLAGHAHQLRRFLSSLYLAISRATVAVELHFSEDDGPIPEVIEEAARAGTVESMRS